MNTDERIDQYIAAAEDFAQPLLRHLRSLVHNACPDVQETIKWGFPNFLVHGEILCSMASFKKHCTFGFWKASLLPDPNGLLHTIGKTAMGHLGKISSAEDLPDDAVLVSYLHAAAKLNAEETKIKKPKPAAKPEAEIPAGLSEALQKNKKAEKVFREFSPSHRKAYIEWIAEAKTQVTRDKRIATAIEWIADGRQRNWKYMR